MPFYTIQRTPVILAAQTRSRDLAVLEDSEPEDPVPVDEGQEGDTEPPAYDSVNPSNSSSHFQAQSIVIDRSLIFPAEPPSTALYQLNHDLNSGHSVSIGRIDQTTSETAGGTPRTRIRDKPIYVFSHRIFNDKLIEITGRRKGAFSYVLMARASSLGGTRWKLQSTNSSWENRSSPMLHCKPANSMFGKTNLSFRWVDAGGKIVAVERKQARLSRKDNRDFKERSNFTSDRRQVLNIVEPLEQRAVDLLVTAWCARVWHDTLETNKAPLTPKEGGGKFTSSTP
ncbi:MAG: hypothetical protein LQ340_001905 [Diploschistes diacapsis]|nr:MAG: hypothetical protein LQ340_001905 [Diploschistes diacapsis]